LVPARFDYHSESDSNDKLKSRRKRTLSAQAGIQPDLSRRGGLVFANGGKGVISWLQPGIDTRTNRRRRASEDFGVAKRPRDIAIATLLKSNERGSVFRRDTG